MESEKQARSHCLWKSRLSESLPVDACTNVLEGDLDKRKRSNRFVNKNNWPDETCLGDNCLLFGPLASFGTERQAVNRDNRT